MSGFKLNTQNTFKFVEDTFADQVVSLKAQVARVKTSDVKIDEHFKKEATLQLMRVLCSKGQPNEVDGAFDVSEKNALSHRLMNKNPDKALAYVPREVAKKFAIVN